MFLTRVFYAGLCVCSALPVWADSAPRHSEAPLLIRADARHSIDPSLQAFIQQVWAESPTVRGAEAALEAARARAEGADKPLHNPALAVEAERTDINTTTFGLSQTLDWSDKRGAFVDIAEQELKAAESGFRETRQRVAVEVFEALVRYFTAHEMQTLAMRRSELMKGFIDAVEQRRAAGDLGAL
ncbi:MAG: TolC family protein, partial [Gammaproteobacteria bacterium]|nr:TolC family protein [Gammaproteobacteria bacterium]